MRSGRLRGGVGSLLLLELFVGRRESPLNPSHRHLHRQVGNLGEVDNAGM